MKLMAMLFAALILTACTVDATTAPPKPTAACRVTRCWPDAYCGIPAGSVHTCANGANLSWSQPDKLGSCDEGPSCEVGALCLVRGGEAGDAVGVCE